MANFTLTTAVNAFTGTSGADIFSGPGGGIDTLNGGGGNDEFHIDSAQAGTIDGGSGTDTVFLDGNEFGAVTFSNVETLNVSTSNIYASAAQLAQFSSIVPTGGGSDFYVFMQNAGGTVNFASMFASPIALHVEASLATSAVTLTGTSRADNILGSNFDDKLSGGAGNDELNGGAGNDILVGGTGADTMIGYTGNDTYYVDNIGDVVDELSFGGTGIDKVYSSISFDLSDAVHAKGNVENLVLVGSAALNGTGNALANAITGNAGANGLYGGAGNDRLDGGGGNDHLTGGMGADKLIGGTGADTFHFLTTAESTPLAASRDVIYDFSHAQGDKIDLSAIDADSTLGGNQAFDFIGTGAFSHTAGELRYKVLNDNVYVYGDTNGDGAADFSIQLNHLASLQASDFLL